MRKRDLQRLLDEAEAESARLRTELDISRAVAEEAHRLIETIAAEPAEHGFVRIHMTDGRPTHEGVLVAREPHYILKHAAVIESADRTIEMDGTVEIPREHVVSVQLLGALAKPD